MTPDDEFNLQNPYVGRRREPLYDFVFSRPRASRGTGPSHTRIIAKGRRRKEVEKGGGGGR